MNKILVILAVAIVAAVGVTAFLLPGEATEEPLPDTGEAMGLVYGNADGNFVIDDTDKRIMEAIIAGEKMFSDFPLADMNRDGAVDQKDLDMLQDFFDRKPMKLNVIEDKGKVVKVQYPIDHLMVMPVSGFAALMNVFDVYDRLTGVAYSNYDDIRDSRVVDLIDKGKVIKADPWGSAATNDLISKTDTQVLITQNHGMWYLDSDENVKILNDFGIDVVRLDFSKPENQMSAMATAGIILDQSESAQAYNEFAEGVLDEIKKVEGDKFGTKPVMMYVGHGWSAKDNTYTKYIDAAGGKNLVTDKGSFKAWHEGDQWIYEEQYDADVMLMAADKLYTQTEFDKATLAKYDSFKNMSGWKDGKVYAVDNSLASVIQIAYYAEAMYPELFEDGWADKVHQEFIDRFFDPSLDFKVVEDRFLMQMN